MSSFLPIRLLGTSFSLKTEENPEYLQGIINTFEHRLEETRRTVGVSDPLKLAILTGILLTEELVKGNPNPELNTREIESLAKSLIEKIDSVL